MRNSLKIYEQIDDYLSNNLSEADRITFEKEIEIDPDLKELVENQQLLIQAQKRKVLRSEIETIAKVGGFPIGKILSFVGVVLVSTAIYLFSGNEPVENQKNISETKVEVITKEVVSNDPTEELVDVDSDPVDTTNYVAAIPTTKNNSYSYEEDTECGGHKTWVEPDRQKFTIDPSKGKTIEGKEGMLIIVPTDAFIDDQGNIIKSPVELELVEALTLEDMVLYDLATLSNGKLLESGGMFYINPTSNGKKVEINPERPFYVEIPTNDVKPGMMAFEGEVDEAGNLNWVNPKPLKKYLVKMDLNELDFLPEGFDDGVEAGLPFRNYKKVTDELVDSLYYTLGEFEKKVLIIDQTSPMPSENNERVTMRDKKLPEGSSRVKGVVKDYNNQFVYGAFVLVGNKFGVRSGKVKGKISSFDLSEVPAGRYNLNVSAPGYATYQSIISVGEGEVLDVGNIILESNETIVEIINVHKLDVGTSTSLNSHNEEKKSIFCGINPHSIKTIRTNNFKDTYVATQEFEKRLAVLHDLDNGQELLDVYLSNLGKDMYVSDSIITSKVNGEYKTIFTNFYNQKLTNIEDANIHQEQLTAYYKSKRQEYKKSLDRLRKKVASKDKAAIDKLYSELNRARKSYQKSYETLRPRVTKNANTNTAKSSISNDNRPKKKMSPAITNLAKSSPSVNVASSNVYAFRWASGGWGNIDAYLHMLSKGTKDVDILAQNTNDKTKVYQWLNAINTLTPLYSTDGKSIARFPKKGTKGASQMRNTYCFAISKDKGKFYWAKNNFNPYDTESLTVSLQESSEGEIRKHLRGLSLSEEKAFKDFDNIEKEILRRKKLLEKQERAKQVALEKAKREKERQEREEQLRKERAATLKLKQQEFEAKKNKVYVELERLNDIREAEQCFLESLMDIAFPCRRPLSANVDMNNSEAIDVTVIEDIIEIEEIFEFVEDPPEYPNGQQSMYAFLAATIVYPEVASTSNIEGTVYVKFVVKKDGSIGEVKVVKGVDKFLDREAIRAVKAMPNWSPGKQRGQVVSTWFTLPINFKLP